MTVRILIVDDHAVLRMGIRMLLNSEDDFEIVGEAGSAQDAIFRARSVHPDVILIDVVMPDQSGLAVIPLLLHEHPDAKLLVLSMADKPSYVREAFAAGASGYVLKAAVGDELIAAIREVARGGRYVDPELGARLIHDAVDVERRTADDPLTQRETEVLQLVTLGHTNREVAEQLHISIRTAEAHRARIMLKLNLSSRAELVRYGQAQGARSRDHDWEWAIQGVSMPGDP